MARGSTESGAVMRWGAILPFVLASACSTGDGGPAADGVQTDGPTLPTGDTDATGTDGADTDSDTDPCGGCPAGAVCGTANGIPVCRDASSGIPRFDHIFLVLMENTSSSTLLDSGNTPVLHGLIENGAYATDYHGVEHPSLPNYLALMSGQIEPNGPTDCDCEPEGPVCGSLNCNTLVSSCGCPQSQDQLVDQLEEAGVTWRAYGESMGSPCNVVEAGDYAPKHVPFLYFPSLTGDAARCADHVVEYTGIFASDLAEGGRGFSYIAPNLIDDMHDPITSGPGNLANGDHWIEAEILPILESPAYTDRGLLLIVWDEDDFSGVFVDDAPIPMVLLSPLAHQGGFVSSERRDHLDLLATLEDAFGVPRLGQAATGTPLSEFFPPE
jgi:hypothetical protein